MDKILFCNDQVEIAVSNRDDGNMRCFDENQKSVIIDNQTKLLERIDLSKKDVARLNIQYDRSTFTEYQSITEENSDQYSIMLSEKQIPICDGFYTNVPEKGLLLPLADCLGLVFYDEKQKVLGLLHAGRHNLEQFGPTRFVETLHKEFGCDPKDLKVFFSPYAKKYEIFKLENKTISETAHEQLKEAGILSESIVDKMSDTTHDDSYPSNSSGDKTERFAIVVKMKSNQNEAKVIHNHGLSS